MSFDLEVYPQDLLWVLAAAVLVIVIVCLVLTATGGHRRRAHRALTEVRERAEADRVATEIDNMYRRASEEVKRRL
jgi:hypothetical protein